MDGSRKFSDIFGNGHEDGLTDQGGAGDFLDSDSIAGQAAAEAAEAADDGPVAVGDLDEAAAPVAAPESVAVSAGAEAYRPTYGDDALSDAPAPAPQTVAGRADNGSGATTLSVSASGDQSIDGILAGIRWNLTDITYSDPDSTSDYQASHPEPLNGFSQMTSQQMDAVHFALNTSYGSTAAKGFAMEGFLNVSFTYGGSGSGTATVRVANTTDPATAYAYYPSNGVAGGDAFFGPSGDFPTMGNYDWHTILHELGHSMGLKHGQDTGVFGALPADEDSMEFSVMTYHSYIGQTSSGYTNETWGYAQTYMMNDIAALQYMYGANYTVNNGNTTYKWNPGSGNTLVNGNVAIQPGGNVIFMTVWDGGGIDTYDLSSYTGGVNVDLAPGGYSVFDQTQLAKLKSDGTEIARGSVFNALLYQGNTASLIENAIGGSGNDTIRGNETANVLTGGAGNDSLFGYAGGDTFRYNNGVTGNDSLYGGAGHDRILVAGAGTFDLHGINVVSVEEIEFNANGIVEDKTVILSNKELDGSSEFATDLLIDGNSLSGAKDTLIINFGTAYGQDKDFSTWTFQDWVDADDSIYINGSSNANNITGTIKNDIIQGMAGADTLDGGAGTDTLSYADSDAGVTVTLGGSSSGGHAAGDVNSGFENLTGSAFADDLTGDVGINYIDGGSGNDTLNHSALGSDTLDGGAGTDTLISASNWVSSVDFDLVAGRIHFSGNDYDTLVSIENVHVGGKAQVHGDGANNYIKGLSSNGKNLFVGGGGKDTLDGGGGNDTLKGGLERDMLLGGAGNDWLEGGYASDSVDGGAGDDTIAVLAGEYYDSVDGGSGIDTLDHSASTYSGGVFDFLSGLITSSATNAGTATLAGIEHYKDGSGSNEIIWRAVVGGTVDAGAGNDTVHSGLSGDETLDGGAGTDTLDTTSFAGDYVIDLAAGTTNWAGESFINFENLVSGAGNDTLSGTNGNNVMDGGAGNDLVHGLDGNDSLSGDIGNDTLVGDNGNDTLKGQGGDDTLLGGSGWDVLDGGANNDLLQGGGGNDSLWAGTGWDTVQGGSGNDYIKGQGGKDSLEGDSGNDTILGDNGNDTVQGGTNNDYIKGGSGWDSLMGGDGNDTILGDKGRDRLDGGAGDDTLTGGSLADWFIFSDGFGDDVIQDFSSNDSEQIDLSGVTGITDFNDLVANHLLNVGGIAMIVDGPDSIYLAGVAFADVGVGQLYSAADFIF